MGLIISQDDRKPLKSQSSKITKYLHSGRESPAEQMIGSLAQNKMKNRFRKRAHTAVAPKGSLKGKR